MAIFPKFKLQITFAIWKKNHSAQTACNTAHHWLGRNEGGSHEGEGGDVKGMHLVKGNFLKGFSRKKVCAFGTPGVMLFSHPKGERRSPQHLFRPRHTLDGAKMRASVRMTRYLESWGAAKPFAHLHHRDSMTTENGKISTTVCPPPVPKHLSTE